MAEKRYDQAVTALERITETQPVQLGLCLQLGDLYMRLGRWRDGQPAYEKALAMDPDNAHVHVGLCRVALRRRKFEVAAQSALDALQRIHHYPLAHFLLGLALSGMKDYRRAAEAFRAAISCNPNFPEAHLRLAALLEKHLNDAESAREHRRLARRMRSRRTSHNLPPAPAETVESVFTPPEVSGSLDATARGIGHCGDGFAALGYFDADADAGCGRYGHSLGWIAGAR